MRWLAETDWWVVLGTGSLGLTIGWLVWTFVARSETLTIKAVGALVSIAAGGGLLALWKSTDTGDLTKEANAYFVGVFLSALVLGLIHGKIPEEPSP